MGILGERASTYIAGVLLPTVCVIAGCSNAGKVTGDDQQTAAATQSETSASSTYAGGVNRIVVSYNDDTGESGKITYGQSSRLVVTGASLMGWSYSEDGGTSWTYGGKVQPPQGWAILWGDPAVTTSNAHYYLAFISNLAVPNSKYPPGGVSGFFYNSDIRSSPIGGACIAKSTDGGKTFSLWQCVSNTDPIADLPESTNGHFYDGGSMASSSSGEIFAAYNDVAASNIDVWRAADENQTFQRLPNPFPGMVAASHPRLRVAIDGTLYVGAQIKVGKNDYRVYLNRYTSGAWGTPAVASDSSALYPPIDLNSTVQGSELTVRTGPQFSFDVGAESAGGNDAIRLLYTQTSSGGRLFISAMVCPANLSSCFHMANWGVPPPGPSDTPLDAFNPDVKAWIGFIGLPPSWQLTYVYRYGASTTTVNVAREALGYVNGNPLAIPVDILQNALVCSDTRGSWADYDEMLIAGFNAPSTTFLRFVTDSSAGCTQRWKFTGVAQHIQAIKYDY